MFAADNVRVTATGSASGALLLGALGRQSDSTWAVRFVPPRVESLTLRLYVDGVLASTATLAVAGLSPTLIDTPGSLRQASLTLQGGAATAAVANGSNAVAFLGEDSLCSLPVVDKSGAL